VRWAAAAAVMIAAALLQSAWGPRLEIVGAFPNLVLLVVVAGAWTLGPRAGMAWACGGGLLLDLLAAGPLGPHVLALLPGAYAIGLLARGRQQPHVLVVAAAAATVTLFYSAVLVVSHPGPAGVAIRLAVAAALYNSLLAPFVFAPVRRMVLGTITRRAQA
jgi:rod shape-determining protein MreD